MNWDDVRIFLAVARAGQILGAARRLDLNHATVSRRVAALEAALGAKLFRRLTTGSEMTPAGERFLEIAERMEADMIAARGAIAGERFRCLGNRAHRCAGRLRRRLPGAAARRADRTARGLKIQLVPVPRSFSLSRREADIAITTERPEEGRLVAQKLVDYSLGLFASRDYAAVHGLPETPAQLAQHRLVGYVPDLVASPSLSYAQEFSPGWEAAFEISSALGQVEAVRADAGIGILHAFIARSMPDLIAVTAAKPIRRAYWLVYHESVRPLRRVQIVAAHIIAEVERERSLFQ